MKRTLSSLPFAASVCKNPWTAFQTDVGPPVRTPPKMQRLLLRSKVPPFLHTVQRSLQLPTQSLFFSLELLSLWTNTIFKQPPYLYSLFQVRYHQLLALHQLVHLQSVADTWDCVWYSKYVQAGGREEGKADIYVLNRMLQAQEWPHSLQLQGPTPPQEHEKTKTKTKKTSKNCQNQLRWNSRK